MHSNWGMGRGGCLCISLYVFEKNCSSKSGCLIYLLLRKVKGVGGGVVREDVKDRDHLTDVLFQKISLCLACHVLTFNQYMLLAEIVVCHFVEEMCMFGV